MDAHYPTDDVPATPEYVLEVFRDWHARLADAGQASKELPPRFEMTVGDFVAHTLEDTWEISGWSELARVLEDMWEFKVPRHEWRVVLDPPHSHTVRELCEFVAHHTTKPAIRPWRHASGECMPAGAFLTVRAMLAKVGADPTEITPSTALEPYLTRYESELEWRLPRLAPGVLPLLKLSRPLVTAALVTFGLMGVTLLVNWAGMGNALPGGGLCPFGLVALFVLFTQLSWHVRPRFISFGELRTFRDLSYALAGQRPRRSIQPTP